MTCASHRFMCLMYICTFVHLYLWRIPHNTVYSVNRLVPVEALRREALGGRSTCLSASLPHDGSSRPRTHREGHRTRSAPPGTARPCLSRACGRRSARVCTCSPRCTRSPAALTDSRMGLSEEDEERGGGERGGGERGGGESVLHHTARYSATQRHTAPRSATQRHTYGVSPPLLLTWFVRTRLHMGLVRVAVSSALGGGRRGREGRDGSREERCSVQCPQLYQCQATM